MELGRGGGECRCHSESCGFSSEDSWTKCSEVCAGATKSRIFLCLWENSRGNFLVRIVLQLLLSINTFTGGWGCFWPVVCNVGKICGWNYSPWTDSCWCDFYWVTALLSWGKAHWWDQQCSGKAGDSWVMELPWAPSWAWGSSQVLHKAQLEPGRASVSSQVCGRQFTARDCSQWIVLALLQSVCWRNKPLNPCQFRGNGSEMIKN